MARKKGLALTRLALLGTLSPEGRGRMSLMSNKKESISRSLGKFTGEIWRALRAPAGDSQKHEVKRTVETEERDTPAGKVTLRRTTIEEIELKNEDG